MKPGNLLSSARVRTTLCIISCIIAYSVSVAVSMGPSTTVPWHDDFMYHMPNFIYVLDSLRYGFGLPMWDPANGGSPVSITSLSLFPYVPYRIAGYVLGIVSGIQELVAYKFSLVMGAALAAWGWWLFLHSWLGSRVGATVGTLVFLFGGSGITVFHQEQALATALTMPWILYFLRKLRDDVRYLPLIAALLGFSLTMHYPHIPLLSLGFFLIAIAVTGGIKMADIRGVLGDRRILLLSAGLFILAVSPLLTVATEMGNFVSPLRGSESIGAGSLAQYVELNNIQQSSAKFSYLLNYLLPTSIESQTIDLYTLFIPYTGLVLAMASLGLRFREAHPVIIVTALGLWAALGINAYMPQLLFMVHFPFIGAFRQWVHFLPVVNLGLAALSALGTVALIEHVGSSPKLRAIALGLLCLAIAAEGGFYMNQYSKVALCHTLRGPGNIDKKEFLSYLSAGTFAKSLHSRYLGVVRPFDPMIMYRSYYDLASTCPSVVGSGVFMTSNVYREPTVTSVRNILEQFCSVGLGASAVTSSLPSGTPLGPGVIINRADIDSEGIANFEMPSGAYAMNAKIPTHDLEVTPSGVRMSGTAPTSGMLVVPYAFGLGLKARVGGEWVRTLPIYGGAMTGMMVSEGPFELSLEMPLSFYLITVFLQYLALISGAAYLYLTRPRLT